MVDAFDGLVEITSNRRQTDRERKREEQQTIGINRYWNVFVCICSISKWTFEILKLMWWYVVKKRTILFVPLLVE